MKPVPDQTTPGRPRDPRIDLAVLTATRELLLEVGYPGVTVVAVAARAGTTTPAVYRRWRTLAHLVHEAAFPVDDTTSLPETGAFATDVVAMVRGAAAAFGAPVARAALPGLVAEVANDPELHTALLARFQEGVWGALHHRIEAAVIAGEARADVDPAALLELVAGATLIGLLIRSAPPTDEWVDHISALLLKGVTP